MSDRPCPDCGGAACGRRHWLSRWGGIDIDTFCRKSVTDALDFVEHLELSEQKCASPRGF